MNEPLLQEPDTWWRFERVEVRDGYLVGVGNPVPYRLRDTQDEHGAVRRRRVALHRLFERLETPQDMAAFATRYGLLGLRHVLVWSVQVRPVRGITKAVRYPDGRLEVVEELEATGLQYDIISSPYAPPLREAGRLLDVGGQLRGDDPWRESIADWKQEVEAIRHAFTLLTLDPMDTDDPYHYARLVAHLFEARLLSVRRVLVWDNRERQWHLFDSPGTLLAAIWLSFWQELRAGVTYGVCEACGFHFPKTRADQRYCPPEYDPDDPDGERLLRPRCDRMRQKAYRQRHAEVLREAARWRRRGERVSLPELRRVMANKPDKGNIERSAE